MTPGVPFEQSLGELESVVKQLESADLPLEKALELFERRETIDIVTVAEALERKDEIEAIGGRAYLRVLNAGFGIVTGVLTKILGTQVLRDVQTFVTALDTMFGGFRERADYTYQLLRAPGTSFLVIAAPEDDLVAA